MLYPLPVVMVSMTDKEGKHNIITIAWAGTVCTNPPMVSISVRPERYSYPIIKETGEFVINLTTKELAFATDYCGVKSGRDVDKFADFKDVARSENGLYYLTKFANAFISVKVTQTIDMGSHMLFIGEMTDGEVLSDKESCSYAYYHANIKPKPAAASSSVKGWRCTICGYEYEGENLPADYICPLCKHPASDFEQM